MKEYEVEKKADGTFVVREKQGCILQILGLIVVYFVVKALWPTLSQVNEPHRTRVVPPNSRVAVSLKVTKKGQMTIGEVVHSPNKISTCTEVLTPVAKPPLDPAHNPLPGYAIVHFLNRNGIAEGLEVIKWKDGKEESYQITLADHISTSELNRARVGATFYKDEVLDINPYARDTRKTQRKAHKR